MGVDVPRCFVEVGAKPIRSRAGHGMHSPVGQVDLRTIEGRFKVDKRQRTFRVKVTEVESLVSNRCTTKQIVVEGVEDSSFLVIAVNLRTVVLENLNRIALVTLVGTGVKVARILISL